MSLTLSSDSGFYGSDIYVFGSPLPGPIFWGASLTTKHITTIAGNKFDLPRVVYYYKYHWLEQEDAVMRLGHKLTSVWRDGEFLEYAFCCHCRAIVNPRNIRSSCAYSEF